MQPTKPRTKSPAANRRRASARRIGRSAIITCLLAVTAVFAYATFRSVGAASTLAGKPTGLHAMLQTPRTSGINISQAGSGAPRSAASSLKPGSLLFFHKFALDPQNFTQVNTLLTLTNTNPDDGVTVRIFYVHDCTLSDKFINLAANQTRTLVVSSDVADAAFYTTGYAMAVAVNPSGVPIQFNWLIGSASLHDAQGRESSYNALAVAKRSAGAAPSDGQAASLVFDNTDYDRLPQTVAVDNIQNQNAAAGDATNMELGFYTPLADLAGGSYISAQTIATAYDQRGQAHPTQISNLCGFWDTAGNIWNDPSLDTFVKPGQPGWATIKATVDVAISRTQTATVPAPVLGLSTTEASTPRHNARPMQALDWVQRYVISMPIKIPTSAAIEPLTSPQPEATGSSNGASENKPGSVLLYARYATGAFGTTQLNITNTHGTQRARVRLFFNSLTGLLQVTDQIITLEPHQTTTLDLNGVAPGQRGWVLAMAINSGAQPINFNYLIGSAQVNEPGGVAYGYNALAVAKNSAGPTPRNADVKSADLIFDDVNYDRLPSIQGLSSFTNQADNTSRLGYARLANTMLAVPTNRGAANVFLYDKDITGYSALLGTTETKIGDLTRVRFSPLLPNSAVQEKSGWMKLQVSSPFLAWFSNVGRGTVTTGPEGAWSGGFSGGGNLHILGVADSYTITVPAGNPGNHPPISDFITLETFIEARRPEGTIVRLDATPASDPDPGDTLTYQWVVDGQSVSNAVILDYRLSIGTHEIKLYVTDSSGQTGDPLAETVIVRDSTPPFISGVPTAITVTTTGNSANVSFPSPSAYDMIDGPVPVSASKPSGSSFPVGTNRVTFTALDKAGNKSTAVLDITVNRGVSGGQTGGDATSTAPTMVNPNDQYVRPGEVRNVLLQASDAEGNPVTFKLTGAPSYARIVNIDPVARQATLQITPPAQSTEFGRVQVVVTDSNKQSFTTLPFLIAISPVPNDDTASGNNGGGTGGGTGGSGGGIGQSNHQPVPVVAALPATVVANTADGALVSLDGSASNDPDMDALTFSWKVDGQEVSQQPIADVKLGIGMHTIILTVSDGRGGIASSNPISLQVLPRPLSITDVTPFRLSRGNTQTLTIKGTGFNQSSRVSIGGAGVTVLSHVSIAEDTIVVQVRTASTAPSGYRDVVVNNADGTSAVLRSKLSLGF